MLLLAGVAAATAQDNTALVARVVQHYALTSANDFPQRDPADWRLLGSNDGGKTWKTLDTRKGEVFGERHERRLFKVPGPAAFNVYRLQIDRVRDPAAGDSVQLAEVEPLGTTEADSDPVPTFEDIITAQGENPPLETMAQAFDGRVETKWLDHTPNNPSTRASWIQWQYRHEPGLVLTNAAQLAALGSRAARGYPARIKGVLAGRLSTGALCFLDPTGHFKVHAAPRDPLPMGGRVLLSGKTAFIDGQPELSVSQLEPLGSAPPAAVEVRGVEPVSGGDLFRARAQGRIGFCSSRGGQLTIDLETGHGSVPVCVLYAGSGAKSDLTGMQVTVEGLCETVLDEQGQRVAGKLWVAGFESVLPAQPWPEQLAKSPSGPRAPARVVPGVLTNLDQVRKLSPEQLVRWPKVRVRAVITELFGACMQDGTAGVEVWFANRPPREIPTFGTLVEIEGRGDYAIGHGPIVRPDVVRILGKGRLPAPVRCSWSELASGRMVSQWIEVEAVVRATDGSHLLLSAEGGQLMGTIRSAAVPEVNRLVDANVRLRGISVAASDSRGRMQGIQLLVPSLDFVEVRQAAADPFGLPPRQIGSLLQLRGPSEFAHRVKVQGVLTFCEGRNYFVQDSSGGAMAMAQQQVVLGSRAGDWNWMFWQTPETNALSGQPELKPGDRVEVVGFPEMGAYSPVLTEVLVRKIQATNVVAPVAAKVQDIMAGGLDSTLVTLEATLLRQQALGAHSVLELQSDQRVYQAIFPAGAGRVPQFEPGSRVRVAGVCQIEPLPYSGLGKSVGSFKILLSSAGDVTVLQRPSWWTLGRALLVAGGLLFGLAVAGGWIAILRRQVSQRTQELQREVADHEKTEAALAAETRRAQAEVEERKRIEAEVEKSHKQLLVTSRMAGMAEVATGVLHNVGNVLNSANVLASLIVEQVQKSKVSSVARLAGLLRENQGTLGRFIEQDQRGQQLPGYVQQLAVHLEQEQHKLLDKTRSLTESIQHIKEIVATQQNYARIAGAIETVPLEDIVEDALRMHSGALLRHQVEVRRDFAPSPPVTLERHKVLQILFNLLENAKYACDSSGRADKQIAVQIRNAGEKVQLTIADNGVGISPGNLDRIFDQDFSTRKGGHGFGLHGSLLAAQELGGTLTAASDGPGQGATFVLAIPMHEPGNTSARIHSEADFRY